MNRAEGLPAPQKPKTSESPAHRAAVSVVPYAKLSLRFLDSPGKPRSSWGGSERTQGKQLVFLNAGGRGGRGCKITEIKSVDSKRKIGTRGSTAAPKGSGM